MNPTETQLSMQPCTIFSPPDSIAIVERLGRP